MNNQKHVNKTCGSCINYKRRFCNVEDCIMESTNKACEDYVSRTCNDCTMCVYYDKEYFCNKLSKKVDFDGYCRYFDKARYKAFLDNRLSVPREKDK